MPETDKTKQTPSVSDVKVGVTAPTLQQIGPEAQPTINVDTVLSGIQSILLPRQMWSAGVSKPPIDNSQVF